MKLTLKFDENSIGWCRKEIFGNDYKKFNWNFLTTTCETLKIAFEKLGSIHLSDIYREFCIDLPDEDFIDYKITNKNAVLVRDELDDTYTINIEIPDSTNSWIPVKERLPEEDGRYLVSFKHNSDIHIFFFAKDIKEYCDNNIGGFSGKIIKDGYLVTKPISGFFDLDFFEITPEEYSAFVDNGHIVAWMPLPEAYKED